MRFFFFLRWCKILQVSGVLMTLMMVMVMMGVDDGGIDDGSDGGWCVDDYPCSVVTVVDYGGSPGLVEVRHRFDFGSIGAQSNHRTVQIHSCDHNQRSAITVSRL